MPLSLNPSVEETLLGLSHGIRERRITCGETLDRCRSKMCEYEPSVQAWVRFGGEELDQVADALDAELRHGNWRGPLHGIPVGIKDIYDVADQPTTAGIPNRQFEPAHRDAQMLSLPPWWGYGACPRVQYSRVGMQPRAFGCHRYQQ